MKSASVTEVKNNLSKYLEQVKNGEAVLITERGVVIARIESVRTRQDKTADEARLARLERAGVITRGRGPIPAELINASRPKLKKGASAVEALLDERRRSRR
jgi:prevent-host-death family protein